MISDFEKETLKGFMADVLRELFGVFDLRRAIHCPSPDHDDGDPSAHYYEDNRTVHCFGCGGTWDVFALVGMVFGLTGFVEQARKVAEIVGYHIDEDAPGGRPAPMDMRKMKVVSELRPAFPDPRDAGAQDCSEACGFAFGELYAPGNEVGRRYLRYRGLDDDDAARFGLGFTRCPRNVMDQFRVYEPEALGFITIPFWNEDFSEARYCMLRTISRGEVRNKEWRPKGVASPLWNEWMLQAGLPCVYVAEGLIDAMVLTKVLNKSVMALGGTSNARRLAQVLHHGDRGLWPGKVVVCMDEDDAGRKAAAAIRADLDRLGIPNSAMEPYPGGAKDADEWLMAGKGVEWEFEPSFVDLNGCTLYRTRWRDEG